MLVNTVTVAIELTLLHIVSNILLCVDLSLSWSTDCLKNILSVEVILIYCLCGVSVCLCVVSVCLCEVSVCLCGVSTPFCNFLSFTVSPPSHFVCCQWETEFIPATSGLLAMLSWQWHYDAALCIVQSSQPQNPSKSWQKWWPTFCPQWHWWRY